MKALIFGISGQDGAYLAQLLLKKGYHVVGTSRDLSNRLSNLDFLGIHDQVELMTVDLLDSASVLKTIQQVKPVEIYSLSAQSSVGRSFKYPRETFESICLATLNILEAVRDIDGSIRTYYACSSECFGNCKIPATENTAFHPTSPYAVAKSAAFWQVVNYRQAYDMFVCSGILSNHESPLRPEQYVTKKIVRAALDIAAGKTDHIQLGNIEIKRDWGWAPEYVEAMWLILQQEHADDFLIATGETYSLHDFARHAFKTLNLNIENHLQIDHSLYRPQDIEISQLSPIKAKQKLDWQSRTNMYGVVEKMIEFYQA